MKLKDIIEKLNLEIVCNPGELDKEVTGGYTSDLLSDVLANSKEGHIWCTLQAHQNIIAVAGMKGIAAIILVGGRLPDEDTIKKANDEKIPILITKLSAFEITGKLYEMMTSGTDV